MRKPVLTTWACESGVKLAAAAIVSILAAIACAGPAQDFAFPEPADTQTPGQVETPQAGETLTAYSEAGLAAVEPTSAAPVPIATASRVEQASSVDSTDDLVAQGDRHRHTPTYTHDPHSNCSESGLPRSN